MTPKPIVAQSQITFLYYRDLESAARFYERTLRFELVEDQQWAKIYRVAGRAFVGIVAGDKGFRRPQDYNAVLLTVLVNDVDAWYDHLKGQDVKFLTEIQDKPEIQVRCFFIEDPGGYAVEIQEFLRPDLVKILHISCRWSSWPPRRVWPRCRGGCVNDRSRSAHRNGKRWCRCCCLPR